MATFRARVRDGHLVIDEPVDLPEGATVELMLVEDDDTMSAEERAEIEASIDRGIEQRERGEGSPAEDVLRRIRAL